MCDIHIFTDGSCWNNGRSNARAGYAVVFPEHRDWDEGRALETTERQTNNRGELWAILRGLEILVEHKEQLLELQDIHIYTDSQLCMNIFTQWILKWKRNGWRKADGKQIENLDLIQRIYEIVHGFHHVNKWTVYFEHVRAHTGGTSYEAYWNDVVDRLAQSVIKH